MTERGAGESRKDHLYHDDMADMQYRNFVDHDEGQESDENANPAADGGNNLHAVNIEPSVEMAGGQSTGRGPRKIRGAMLHKSVGCSKAMAVCLLLLILGSILMIAIVASFARPRCMNPGTNATSTPPTVAPTEIPGPWKNVRLPDNIIPRNYTIFLHPNLITNEVVGNVDIVLQANSESTELTNFIVFHAADMNVTEPTRIVPQESSQDPIEVVSMIRTEKPYELVYLELAKSIPPGKIYTLSLEFNYTLAEGLKGFYRSTYKIGNEER